MHRFRRFSAALVVAGVLGVAAPAAASATSLVTISGATASYPLVSLLAQKYVKLHPKKVKFKIAQGGAQVGINDVAAGRVSIADVSRDPIASDKGLGLVFYPIARYAICVVTNKSNPLGNLTQSQLIGIFTGKIKTWSAVPGATATGTIDLISRTSVAGVLTNFQTLLLEGKSVASSATEESSEGLMKQQVESDPNSIGFLSNYQVETGGVNAVVVQRRRLQQSERSLRRVRRCGALLRGHQGPGQGCRLGVHRLDRLLGGGQEDHQQPVDPDRLS